MGLFTRRRSSASREPQPQVDPSLPDDAWMAESRNAFRSTIDAFYGSPETMASGGQRSATAGDTGVALCFYAKAIDMLHTAYGFSQMQARRPSREDGPIVDGFCDALEGSLSAHPAAPTDDEVREVTHRLRSIATTCDEVGVDSALYRAALERLGALTPHVRVDDILWT